MSCAHCINCTLIVTNLEPGVIPNVLKETLARTNKMNKYLGNVHHDEEWVSEKEATKIEKKPNNVTNNQNSYISYKV